MTSRFWNLTRRSLLARVITVALLIQIVSEPVFADWQQTEKSTRRRCKANDLTTGVRVDTLCVDRVTMLPGGGALQPGCYDVTAFVIPERHTVATNGTATYTLLNNQRPLAETHTFTGRLRFSDAQTNDIVTEIEANTVSVEDTGPISEGRPNSEITVQFEKTLHDGNLFTFATPRENCPYTYAAAADTKMIETCAQRCTREACGKCSTTYAVMWDRESHQCSFSTSNETQRAAGGACVADQYSKCWEQSCNLVGWILDGSLAVSGLFGFGGLAGRAIRFGFSAWRLGERLGL
jgi:hypothetical protein